VERTQDGTRLLGEEKKGAVRHWAGGGAQTRGESAVCGVIARGFTINARHDGLWIGVDDLGRSTAGPACRRWPRGKLARGRVALPGAARYLGTTHAGVKGDGGSHGVWRVHNGVVEIPYTGDA
jgi:hypothetical protein